MRRTPGKIVLSLAGTLLLGLFCRGAAPPGAEGFARRTDFHGDWLPDCAIARMGSMWLRHSAMIPRLAFSRDGRFLASVGATVRVWDMKDGRLVRELPANAFFASSVAFSPDGKRLVSAGEKAIVWDLATGKGRPLWDGGKPHPRPAKLAFSPNGKVLAVGCIVRGEKRDDSEVRLFDFPSGRPLGRLETGGGDWFYALAFSADGKALAVAVSGSLRVWGVARRELLFSRKGGVGVLAFSPDGKRLALAPSTSSSSASGPVSILDWRSNKEVAKADAGKANVRALCFAPDGKALLGAASRGRALALDPLGRLPPRELLPKESAGYYPALSPDGKLAAFADVAAGVLRVRDLGTGRERPIFDDHRGPLEGKGVPIDAVLSPDGRRIATRTPTELRVWDARTGRPLKKIAGGKFSPGLGWSPDGKALVAADEARVGWWDADTGALGRQLPLPRKGLRRFSLSADGSKLLCVFDEEGGRQIYRRLSAATGKEDLRAQMPDGEALAALAPDGGRYVTRGTRAVRLHDARTGREVWKRDVPHSHVEVGFSPDGRLVVGAIMPGVQAWEGATGRPLGPMPRRSDDDWLADGVSVAPDGRTAAATFQEMLLDKTRFQGLPASRVVLYETATGRVRRRLPAVDGLLRCAFSADGGRLISGSTDQTALVWDVYAPRGRLRGPLTPAEANAVWEALAGADAEAAFDVVCRLSAAPDVAVAVLRPRLRPAVALDVARARRLLARLGADEFAHREQATKELADLGEEVEPLLRGALEGRPALEVRLRVERLLRALAVGGGGPACWRRSRALEALERAGSPEAVRLVRALAAGHAGSRLTREAGAALARLRGRGLAGTD